MTFPAISHLRNICPEARVDIMARSWVAPIYRCHPRVDKVVDSPEGAGLAARAAGMLRAALRIRNGRYDKGVLMPNSFESALLFRMAGIPEILGYVTDFRRFLLNRPVPVPDDKERKHHVFYYLNLVGRLEGGKAGTGSWEKRLEFQVPEEERKKARAFLNKIKVQSRGGGASFFTGFNPGAAFGPAKCWPPARFRQLAGLLLDAHPGMHILVFGTEREGAIAEEIRSADPERVTSLCGKTSLLEAAALISQLGLLVTNDSGLMHVGAACSIPLVAIFGSTNPVATGPWSENARIVSLDLDCAPCMSRTCPRNFECMMGIDAVKVFEAARKMLEERIPGEK